MKHRITSLPALSCFRVAAEFESFSQAADQLNLTHGAISRAVRLLEQDLGVALFDRRNRRVFLTDVGRELATSVTSGLGQIERTIRTIRERQTARVLVLSCEPTLLMRWLIPRMGMLQTLLPEPKLHLVAGGGPVSLGAGIDLAIRRNDFDLPADYYTAPLFDEKIGLVCRPDKIAAFFDSTGLLPNAHCLHTQTRPDAWKNWARITGASAKTGSNDGTTYEHFYFSLQAAVAGLGVAVGPWHLVKDDIASGLLCAPLGFLSDGSSYQLLSRTPIKTTQEAAQIQCALQTIAK